MKVALVVFPGSNRDRDMALAIERSFGAPPLRVWHGDSELPALDLIVLPGGFSYGDYLRAGAMAAHSPIMTEVVRRARAGTPTLGVCNGFQVLVEAGLVPGALMRNASLKFVCRTVRLRVEANQTMFTNRYEAGQVIEVPVAHHDGNYFADRDVLARLEDQDQIAFRYCTPEGAFADAANPNGSIAHIAGVFNEGRSVLGMMPHPENVTDPALGGTDGRALFDGLTDALAA